jgi:hypothetical protein
MNNGDVLLHPPILWQASMSRWNARQLISWYCKANHEGERIYEECESQVRYLNRWQRVFLTWAPPATPPGPIWSWKTWSDDRIEKLLLDYDKVKQSLHYNKKRQLRVTDWIHDKQDWDEISRDFKSTLLLVHSSADHYILAVLRLLAEMTYIGL